MRGSRDLEGRSGEGGDLFPVDNHRDNEVSVVHLDKVVRVESWLELFYEERSVVGGDAEGNGRADVSEDGVADGISHLGDVLVRNGEV